MSDQPSMDPFERRLARGVMVYTDVATARPIDATAIARTALAPTSTRGRSRSPGMTARRRRVAARPWAAAVAAIVVVAISAIAIQRLPSDPGTVPASPAAESPTPSRVTSSSLPVPEVLLHAWQRPYMVSPGQEEWPTGYLTVTAGGLEIRADLADAPTRSAIVTVAPDTLIATATLDTIGCRDGDVGTYLWTVKGKGTVLTLTAIGADACSARQAALDGDWVRADLPSNPVPGEELSPGRHETSLFDPFEDPTRRGQLSYTVAEGWKVKEDTPDAFLLHYIGDVVQGAPPNDTFLLVLADPRVAAELEAGAACEGFTVEPGADTGVEDIVAALTARPGVRSALPVDVSIDGYDGVLLDLELAQDWTGGCQAVEGFAVGIPLLTTAGPGPGVGLGPDTPVRLLLVDLGAGRTVAIAINALPSTEAGSYEEAFAGAMPVIESFDFQPRSP